jgi:hypothetical protein
MEPERCPNCLAVMQPQKKASFPKSRELGVPCAVCGRSSTVTIVNLFPPGPDDLKDWSLRARNQIWLASPSVGQPV